MIWFGGQDVLEVNGVTPGLLIAFITYINMFFRPIRELADKFNTLQMGMVCSERVLQLLNTNDVMQQDEPLIEVSRFEGNIELKDLWLSYKPEEWI